MANQTTKYANPVKLYYGNKEFTIGSLGLEPPYALALYRVVKFRRPDGILDGITFEEITSIRTIGVTKAQTIAKALAKIGVEVKNIPEITEPTTHIRSGLGTFICTNCHEEITDNWSVSGKPYKYCPMCGKKLKIRED